MELSRPFRFPLATGDAMLLGLWAVGALGGVGFGPLLALRWLPGWAIWPIGVVCVLWALLALAMLPFVWRRRASDVVMAPQGVEVLGGFRHGRRWAYEQLRRARVMKAGELWMLALSRKVVATTEDAAEKDSFQAVVDTLRALVRKESPARASAKVLKCRKCGAPNRPRDEERVPCEHCGAEVKVPEDMRAIAALKWARQATARTLRELLRWPSARVVNTMLLAAFVPAVAAWPLSALFVHRAMAADTTFTWLDFLVLAAGALNASVLLPAVLRLFLLRRRAVKLVALRFAARPEERAGEGQSCRHCGAALGTSEEVALVVCDYCGTDNVLGLHLAIRATAEQAQAKDLDALLEARLAERSAYRRRVALAVVSVAVTPLFMVDLLLRARWQGEPFAWLFGG